MDSNIIYKTSDKLKLKINWIKPTETEWIYCGAKGEVKLDIVDTNLNSFLDGESFYIACTRTNSFTCSRENLISAIEPFIGDKDFLVWTENFQKTVEFNRIGVF